MERRRRNREVEGVLGHGGVLERGDDDLDGPPYCPLAEPPGQRCSRFDGGDHPATIEHRQRRLARPRTDLQNACSEAEPAAFGKRLEHRGRVSGPGLVAAGDAVERPRQLRGTLKPSPAGHITSIALRLLTRSGRTGDRAGRSGACD